MRTCLLLVLLVEYGITFSQNLTYEEQIKEYEPNSEFPFGRLNPKAPPETVQFDFMVGICDCIDSIRNADGSWLVFPTIWQGKYFLNGYGIQDNYFNPQNPTSNIRLFDPVSKTWKVTYVQSAKGYFVGTWEGKKEEDKIILKQEQKLPSGQTNVSRLTFSNISTGGFDWISESISEDGKVSAGWIQHCKKRN